MTIYVLGILAAWFLISSTTENEVKANLFEFLAAALAIAATVLAVIQ